MIIRPEAEADLVDARNWYERQRKRLGDEFLLCVEEVFERISRMPEMHAVVYEGGLAGSNPPVPVCDLRSYRGE